MLVLLYILWLVFNARVTVEILVLGVVIDVLLYFLMRYTLDFSIKKELKLLKVLPTFLHFLAVLFVEVIKSNFMVLHKVITGLKDEKGEILRFKTDLKYEFTQVLFANAITLTPGTITVKLKDGNYIVHGLTKEFSDGVETCKFYQILKQLEEKLDD